MSSKFLQHLYLKSFLLEFDNWISIFMIRSIEVDLYYLKFLETKNQEY